MGKNELMCFQYRLMCFLFAVVPHNDHILQRVLTTDSPQQISSIATVWNVLSCDIFEQTFYCLEKCVYSVLSFVLVVAFSSSASGLPLFLTLTLSVSFSLPSTRCRVQKNLLQRISCPLFPYMVISVAARPSSCCERGACTNRRRSPFASIFGSESNKNRTGWGWGWISSIL